MLHLSKFTAVLMASFAAGCSAVGTHQEMAKSSSAEAILANTRSIDARNTANPVRVARSDPASTADGSSMPTTASQRGTRSETPARPRRRPKSVQPHTNVAEQAARLPDELSESRGQSPGTDSVRTMNVPGNSRGGGSRKPGQVRTSPPPTVRIRVSDGKIDHILLPSADHKPANYATDSSAITSPRRTVISKSESEIRLVRHESEAEPGNTQPVSEAIQAIFSGSSVAGNTPQPQHCGETTGQAVTEPAAPVSAEVQPTFAPSLPQQLATSVDKPVLNSPPNSDSIVTFRGAIKSFGGGFAAQLHIEGPGTFTVHAGDEVPLSLDGSQLTFTVEEITNDSVRLKSSEAVLIIK